MALDQQRNWTVSMAENLDKILRSSGDREKTQSAREKPSSRPEPPTISEQPVVWETPAVHLPDEIIIQILEYVSHFREAQYTLASCCRLSLQWYSAGVQFLYERPYLYGKNFDPFASTIIPSKNLHIRHSPLAELVKVLNMGNLVHQGSRSLTARLLGRTKNSLEEFVAPQASFALNCFPALSRCRHLRHLDLSLVSESPQLPVLFKTLSHLEHLKSFNLPRSAGFGRDFDPATIVWPPSLEDLVLSGGIDMHFMHGIVAFPSTLRSLTIEHCPLAKGGAVMHLLRAAVRSLPNLQKLKLAHLPRLAPNSLDQVLFLLPRLRKLSVSVDYVTPCFFDLSIARENERVSAQLWSMMNEDDSPPPHIPAYSETRESQLCTLELTVSGTPGVEDKISPIDILIAIEEGVLPHLRQVRVAKSLLWHSGPTTLDVEALTDALQELRLKALANDEGGVAAEDAVGVWAFDG